MNGLIVIEMKGFREITKPLLQRMEKLNLNDTHIRNRGSVKITV